MARLTLTVREAAAAIGISPQHAYALIAKGDLPAIHLGRRVVVPKVQLDEFLAGRSA